MLISVIKTNKNITYIFDAHLFKTLNCFYFFENVYQKLFEQFLPF